MNHCCLWLLLFTCLLQATNVECLLPSFSLRRHHPLHQSPYTRNHDFQSCLFQQTSQRNWDHHENTTTTTIEDSIGVANEFKGNRIRFRGRVAYDGSGFRGWQVQSREGRVR
jgi:Pseudouridylate synthase